MNGYTMVVPVLTLSTEIQKCPCEGAATRFTSSGNATEPSEAATPVPVLIWCLTYFTSDRLKESAPLTNSPTEQSASTNLLLISCLESLFIGADEVRIPLRTCVCPAASFVAASVQVCVRLRLATTRGAMRVHSICKQDNKAHAEAATCTWHGMPAQAKSVYYL